VISAPPDFQKQIEELIARVLMRPRDIDIIANDVLEMRKAVADEKGENDIWDLKYAAGGIVDIEFLAQYLQLIHAAEKPGILNVNTMQVYDNAVKLGVLASSDAEILRPAARLYQNLTQVLRLCVSEKFKPDTAGEDLLRVMTRAADAPDFSAVEARLRETQAEVREIFLKLMQARP
jgi:glutamate-ammonia-ligase adenylyltransferase